jgi:hypothetical protein
MAMLKEEKEKTGCSRDHTAKKKDTCTTHTWSHIYDHSAELFIIRSRELLILFSEINHMLLQGHELLRLGTRYRLRAPNGWDTTGDPLVLDCSVGESIHPISIGSTRRSCLHQQIQIKIQVGRRIVPLSLSQPAILCLLEIKTKSMKLNSRK